MRGFWLVVVGCLLTMGLGSSRSAMAAGDLSQALQNIVETYEVPGIAAAVTDRDGILAMGCAGVRRTGGEQAIDINDKFHLGSCGKAMTATVIAKLVEDGQLSWNMTLGEVFDEQKDRMQPGYADITLAQLLTHRSGMPANPPRAELNKWRQYDDPMLLHDGRMLLLVDTIQRPLEHQPGEAFLYSNLGYVAAALMAEQVTGKVWERLVRERLFVPLKLSSAGFGPPNSPQSPGRINPMSMNDAPAAMGHDAQGIPAGYAISADNPQVISPAGTIHMSLPDWTVFARAHLDAGRGYPRLLSASTFQRLHTPAPKQGDNDPLYAMGWGQTSSEAWTRGPALFHQGSNTLWLTQIWIAPKRDLAICVAVNQGGEKAEKACNAAVAKIVEIMGRD